MLQNSPSASTVSNIIGSEDASVLTTIDIPPGSLAESVTSSVSGEHHNVEEVSSHTHSAQSGSEDQKQSNQSGENMAPTFQNIFTPSKNNKSGSVTVDDIATKLTGTVNNLSSSNDSGFVAPFQSSSSSNTQKEEHTDTPLIKSEDRPSPPQNKIEECKVDRMVLTGGFASPKQVKY